MAAGSNSDGAVLHFAARWLPASEGFVYDLVTRTRRRAVVTAGREFENLDRFSVPDLHRIDHGQGRLSEKNDLRVKTAQLMWLARTRRVALVHAHHGYEIYKLMGFITRSHLPLVVSLHGDDISGWLETYPDSYEVAKELATAVVVPSKFLIDHAVAAGFNPAAIRVMPSGVDTTRFVPTPLVDGPPVALFVGRFVEKKGLDVLAAAWPRVRAVLPEAKLRLMGFGALEALARSIEGAEVIIAPTRDEVAAAMGQCHLVVAPSHSAPGDAFETLLVVNLEAQASGRAVVTTRHGAIPEYVDDGVSALVVPEADADALAGALIDLLGDRQRAASFGAAGVEFVQRFDLTNTVAAMDALYDEVAA